MKEQQKRILQQLEEHAKTRKLITLSGAEVVAILTALSEMSEAIESATHEIVRIGAELDRLDCALCALSSDLAATACELEKDQPN